MIVATYLDYALFKQAIEKAAHSNKVTVFQSISNAVPSIFSAVAAFESANHSLRLFLDTKPTTFDADFPKAITANGVIVS